MFFLADFDGICQVWKCQSLSHSAHLQEKANIPSLGRAAVHLQPWVTLTLVFILYWSVLCRIYLLFISFLKQFLKSDTAEGLGCYLFFSYLRVGQILYFWILGTVMVTPFQQWSQMFLASVTVLSLGLGDQELSLGSCVALKCSLAGVVAPDSKGKQDTAMF